LSDRRGPDDEPDGEGEHFHCHVISLAIRNFGNSYVEGDQYQLGFDMSGLQSE
jgi:hypothetical protein